ncbi:MAG TPA: ABC transporter permease [Pseudoneobacillus sp.]|nr:ABC transporter permease [Pseudoneobacillus sp.]
MSLAHYAFRRLLQAIPLLFIIFTLTFILMSAAPGNPVWGIIDPMSKYAGEKETIDRIEKRLGTDQPIYIQYIKFVNNVLHGNLGNSFVFQRPVAEKIVQRAPNTLLLVGISLIISTLIGIIVGVISALKKNKWIDNLFTFISFLSISIPGFFMAIVIVLIFSLHLGWFPVGGMRTDMDHFNIMDRIKHMVLPVFVLVFLMFSSKARFMRSSMIEQLKSDYIKTARSKGLSEGKIIWKHALRNALLPVVIILTMQLPSLVGGAAFIEMVFAWPGVGGLALKAMSDRDYPLIMGITLVFSVAIIISNLLADIIHGIIDPRVRNEIK